MAELFDIIGKAALRISTQYTHSLTSTYSTLQFDQKTVERGGLTSNLTTNSILIDTTGAYEIVICIDADYANNQEMLMMIHVNGIAYSALASSQQGRGTGKPMNFSWTSTTNLTAGDIVDVRIASEATSYDAEIRRLMYSIKRDH